MAELAELAGQPDGWIISPYIHDPVIQKVLDRAAAGDASVLPEVQRLLKHQSCIDCLGDVAAFALDALITAAAGDNVAVQEQIRIEHE